VKKTVLITGASSGIGKATAKLFAASGWNVVATMRAPERESELAALADILITRLDVQDPETIQESIDAGITRFSKIEALINNAGYGQYGIFESIPREKIQQQFDVNVLGVMDVTRAILPHFRKNQSGVIVNISSGAGIFTLPMISLYCASKFALEGFSEALAWELASQNIIVKIVEPHGGVDGTRFPERSAAERTDDDSLPDYAEFLKRTSAVLNSIAPSRKASTEDVARVIYLAATDGTNRLRYLIGDDTRGFIKARRELPDQDYIDFMRTRLFPRP
jgi:NAD(P)-dependent dehydrogenase (short-subunit alcohol dehydrogenase family)